MIETKRRDRMINKIVYFDHAATTGVREEVLKEMIPFFHQNFGNPSSVYSIGRKNRKVIEEAREKVAKVIVANPEEVYFTSCGSESDNLAIKGIAYANRKKGNHIITSKIEHPAVLNTCKSLEKEGYEVTYLDVDSDGMISISNLKSSIKDTTILISIMFANNEIGTIQPIEEIGDIAKAYHIYFHTDAVQAIGNVKINVKNMNIDLLSMSAHKFYGPKGVGALYVKTGVEFDKIQDGGHQEKNKRAGTENVAGIVGLGKAIELAYLEFDKNNETLRTLRDYYITKVENIIPYIKRNGHRIKRLPGNANISFMHVNGESLLMSLDAKGICASAGSACSSGSLDPSHVLMAIGLTEQLANGSLRVTFGIENTKEEVDYMVESLAEIVKKLRNENR